MKKPGLNIIQIHPTLTCNLKCRHCYSSSGPALKGQVSYRAIADFLDYARGYGFNVISVSGGEPFLYRELEELLQASHLLGYKNLTASNGMLLRTERARKILEHIDLIAISIDGDRAFHDEVRNQPGAYDKMLAGVTVLREMKIPFGFIHTITEHSWENLISLADFVYEQGAGLLQLHPLELTGRAVNDFADRLPSQNTLHKVFILSTYLEEKYNGKMKIQLDYLHKEFVLRSPASVSYLGEDYKITTANFADTVKSLIMDEAGYIYPMSYGFDPFFSLGNIRDIGLGKDIFSSFIEEKGENLYALIKDVYHKIAFFEDDMIKWTELIVHDSHAVCV